MRRYGETFVARGSWNDYIPLYFALIEMEVTGIVLLTSRGITISRY